MKKVLILLLMVAMLPLSAFAAKFHRLGDDAKLAVYRFGEDNYLLLYYKDNDDAKLTDSPVMILKLTDGTTLSFSGNDEAKRTKMKTTSWMAGVSRTSSEDTHYVLFFITPEEIQLLQKEVSKVTINTLPNVYLKTTISEKGIGSVLYKEFMNLGDSYDF